MLAKNRQLCDKTPTGCPARVLGNERELHGPGADLLSPEEYHRR